VIFFPLQLETWTNGLLPDFCQGAVSKPIVWITFASSVVTDLYLLIIPIPMLWGTTLRLAKKISISIVLGAGIFVLVCSLLKTVFVETVSSLEFCVHLARH
tara:strand:+ start:477 stop:779 length:303 start_codon:yes stop_codon:yes gene_type:complete